MAGTFVVFIILLLLPIEGLAQSGPVDPKSTPPPQSAPSSSDNPETLKSAPPSITVGRFQLLPTSNDPTSMFLLDTATGCVWSQIENTETKRMTFVEVDIENLHWSYGSGAQQLLAEKIDASNLADVQKTALKEELRKTGCGLSSNLVLTPGRKKPPK